MPTVAPDGIDHHPPEEPSHQPGHGKVLQSTGFAHSFFYEQVTDWRPQNQLASISIAIGDYDGDVGEATIPVSIEHGRIATSCIPPERWLFGEMEAGELFPAS